MTDEPEARSTHIRRLCLGHQCANLLLQIKHLFSSLLVHDTTAKIMGAKGTQLIPTRQHWGAVTMRNRWLSTIINY